MGGPLALAFAAVLAAALSGGACSKSSGNCNSLCPEGCDVSSDCLSCVPESDVAGLGTSCNGPNDCCVGSCVGGVCIASAGDGGGSSSSSSGSASASGSSSGSTGGTHAGCQPWTGNPLPSYDAACNTAGATTEVCSESGTCIPNCNDSAGYCGSEVCQVNGHCKTAGGNSSGTVVGGSSGSVHTSGTTRGGSSSGAFGTTGFGSTGFGGSGFGGSGFGASSGFGGNCGQTGVASCSKSSESIDCCSGYCVSSVCACNKGGGQYPCVGQNDCCSGAVCTLGICE